MGSGDILQTWPTSTALVQGTLDMLILRALRWEPTHGAGRGRVDAPASPTAPSQVEEGTLYPALRRLEERGHDRVRVGRARSATARPATTSSRPRAGSGSGSELERWERYVDTMNRVLRYGTAGSIRGR